MNAIEMKDSAERVARGAAYMDENYPGWERKINLEILNIASPNSCICGQVVTGIGYGSGWGVVNNDLARIGEITGHYGFDTPQDGDAWVSLIKERFDTGALSDAGLSSAFDVAVELGEE
jgi:hypothetical protein